MPGVIKSAARRRSFTQHTGEELERAIRVSEGLKLRATKPATASEQAAAAKRRKAENRAYSARSRKKQQLVPEALRQQAAQDWYMLTGGKRTTQLMAGSPQYPWWLYWLSAIRALPDAAPVYANLNLLRLL